MEKNNAYRSHLNTILAYGSDESARGLSFRELIGVQYTVPMNDPVVTIPERNTGYRFAAAEPFWILSGSNLLSEIAPYGNMAPYSDDGYFMAGAYGPKVVDQLPYVCRTLAEDNGSRQAVINIWREKPGPSKDIPCTLSLQFLLRNGRLHCVATMRSSDAIMGLPYDTIMFSLASAYISSILCYHYGNASIKLGLLRLTMGSAHIYDRDMELAKKITRSESFDCNSNIDFNNLSQLTPSNFLEMLASFAMDENAGGILEVGSMR